MPSRYLPVNMSFSFLWRLLLDSRGVDLTIAYNSIFDPAVSLKSLFSKGLINDLRVSDAHVNIRPWNPTRA
jgi:hypothetical protein